MNEFPSLLQLGIAGVFLYVLIRGEVVPRATLEREIKRGDDAIAAVVAFADSLKSIKDELVHSREVQAALAEELLAVKEELRALKESIA